MNHSTCKRLFKASKALLTSSGLVRWNGNTFVATHPTKDDSAFEKYARTKFHPCYGRYMCWVLFSVGAENLAKAACTCSGVVKIPNSPSKLPYPIYEDWLSLKDWGDKVLNGTRDENDPPQPEKYDFGDLGEYWQCEKYLDKLCNKCKVLSDNRKMLKASYKYLAHGEFVLRQTVTTAWV